MKVKNRITNNQKEQDMTSSLIISSISVKFSPQDAIVFIFLCFYMVKGTYYGDSYL